MKKSTFFLAMVGIAQQNIAVNRSQKSNIVQDNIHFLQLGLSLLTKEQPEKACATLNKLISMQPNLPDLVTLGFIYDRLEKGDAAQIIFEHLHQNDFGNQQIEKKLRELYLQKAKVYQKAKQYEKAIEWYNKAIEINPHNIAPYFPLVSTLTKIHAYHEALEKMETVLRYAPLSANVWYNKAYCLKQLTKYKEAIPAYLKAIELKTSPIHQAYYGLGLAYLAAGNLDKGWDYYRYRHAHPDKFKPENIPTFKNKRILIISEFGLGDVIHFIRYAQLLKEAGAKILVASFKSMIPLLSLCPYIDDIVEITKPYPAYDYAIPSSSLPLAFNTTLETIPKNIPYLYVSQHLITEWANKLAHDTNFKIGICWQGNPDNPCENQLLTQRAIPLKTFTQLSTIPGISLYSLQKINGTDQLNQLPETCTIKTFDNFDEDNGCFMDTAALMKNLDLFISADTSTVHLAGALGVPVWVLVPHGPAWQWMLNRTDSPWYPTMRLFRCQTPGDWNSVMQEVVGELQKLIQEKNNPTQTKS